jgi:hypothetical protein
MKREDDVGEEVTKKIGNQSLFLLEILLIIMNGAEMLTAAGIAAVSTAFEISYSARLILHAVFALVSVLGGFALSRQLKEAFVHWKQPVQWVQAFFSLCLVVGGPLANLFVMAYSMNQLSALRGYASIGTGRFYTDGVEIMTMKYVGLLENVNNNVLDPTLFTTLMITIFHCFLVLVISVIAYDKVYGSSDVVVKVENKKATPKVKDAEVVEEVNDAKDKKSDKKLDYRSESLDLMSFALGGEPKPFQINGLVVGTSTPDNIKGWIVNVSTDYKKAIEIQKMAVESANQATIQRANEHVEKQVEKFKKILSEIDK